MSEINDFTALAYRMRAWLDAANSDEGVTIDFHFPNHPSAGAAMATVLRQLTRDHMDARDTAPLFANGEIIFCGVRWRFKHP